MGWWRSRRNPESMLGDGPADQLHLALERLAREVGGRLTFQTLLDGAAAALAADAPALVADPDRYRGQLTARFDRPAPAIRSGSGSLE